MLGIFGALICFILINAFRTCLLAIKVRNDLNTSEILKVFIRISMSDKCIMVGDANKLELQVLSY